MTHPPLKLPFLLCSFLCLLSAHFHSTQGNEEQSSRVIQVPTKNPFGKDDDQFRKSINETLKRIPQHLMREVYAAGIRVFAPEDISKVEPKVKTKRAAMFDADSEVVDCKQQRKRILFFRSKFKNERGRFYQKKKGKDKAAQQELKYVVAHEFGHAFDYVPAYVCNEHQVKVSQARSSAPSFIEAYELDLRVQMSMDAKKPQHHIAYLAEFKPKNGSKDPVDARRARQEAFAEAMAIHLALEVGYSPYERQLWFQRYFHNVMNHVHRYMVQQRQFAVSKRYRDSLPVIASVQEIGEPPAHSALMGQVRIRSSRFAITIAGLDPAAEYRLFAYFDDERLAMSDVVTDQQKYTMRTEVGFPPGRYLLTVRVVQTQPCDATFKTQCTLVDYQPTYVRDMKQPRHQNVTATAHTDTLGRFGSESVQHKDKIQVKFIAPNGTKVRKRFMKHGNENSNFESIPSRTDLIYGVTYQLELKNDSSQPNWTVFPTLDVANPTRRTRNLLNHSAIPIQLTSEEISLVKNGGSITKVVYAPHQTTNGNSYETLVSRCPGDCVDPTKEAARYGTILLIIRIGDKDVKLNASK